MEPNQDYSTSGRILEPNLEYEDEEEILKWRELELREGGKEERRRREEEEGETGWGGKTQVKRKDSSEELKWRERDEYDTRGE